MGGERFSRLSQVVLNVRYKRMRAPKNAYCGPFYLLKYRHGFAEIVERGGGVRVEHICVTPPHLERDCVTLATNTLRHGYRFEQHRLAFFEVLYSKKGQRVVLG